MRAGSRERDFTEFFVAHAAGLRRTAYLLVHDWHLAEDLTQQGLVKLYLAWPRTRSGTRLAYARRIVVNECLTYLRRKRPESATEALPERPSPDQETAIDIGSALRLLPPRQRAIVALRFLDDLPVAEVATLLEVAPGTVKSQTARALDTLRRHLPELAPTLSGLPTIDPLEGDEP